MVRQWQQIDYGGRYCHSYMDALPDFVKLAEAYGHVGMLIEKPQDVEPALREARKLKDRTVFMDFRTDPTENVWPMVKAGQGHHRDAARVARTCNRRTLTSIDELLAAEPALPCAGEGTEKRNRIMKHIIAVLLENEPGALSRVVGLFSARGYNIETLTVAPTEDPSLSRMTIVRPPAPTT